MTHRLPLTALILLSVSAPTAAQPGPASKPTGPSTGKTIAHAMAKLMAGKGVERLLKPRYYRSVEPGDRRGLESYVKLSGIRSGKNLVLEVRVDLYGIGTTRRCSYTVGPSGGLLSYTFNETSRKADREDKTDPTTIARVVGDKLLVVRDTSKFALSWSDANVPVYYLWFVVPSLIDQGLPARLNAKISFEADLGAGRTFSPQEIRIRRAPTATEHHLLTLVQWKVTAKVAASGPQVGRVVRLDMGPSRYDRIPEATYAQILGGLRAHLAEVRLDLCFGFLRRELESHKQRHGAYPTALNRIDPPLTGIMKLLRSTGPIYRVEYRTTPDGAGWMILASPRPSKTPGRYLMIGPAGKTYAATKAVKLTAACAIPSHAKPFKPRPKPR